MELPPELLPRGLAGGSRLKYDTKDTGPPRRVIGPALLAGLIKPCYVTAEGKGEVAFNVIDGWIMREKLPPYAPLIELTMSVGQTSETFKVKGPRGCARPLPSGSFWSHKFLIGKKTVGPPNQILIDGWTFGPGPGIFAEKTITSNCGGGAGELPGFCVETTTLRLKPK